MGKFIKILLLGNIYGFIEHRYYIILIEKWDNEDNPLFEFGLVRIKSNELNLIV